MKMVHSSSLIVHGKGKKPINHQLSTINRKAKGFTLIELIVVITIIAILVAAISISWAKAQEKSRDGRRKSDLKAVQQALDTYFEATGSFPSASTGKIYCREMISATPPTFYYQDIPPTGIDWGANFTCTRNPSHPQGSGGPDTFFQTFPKDPVYQSDANKGYFYSVNTTTGKSYTLSVKLENANDSDKVDNCGPNGRDYCVTNQ